MASTTYRCGHARSDDNIRWNNGYANCRTCYLAGLKAYRQRNNRAKYNRKLQEQEAAEQREAVRLRRLKKLLLDHAAAKPHLYKHAA